MDQHISSGFEPLDQFLGLVEEPKVENGHYRAYCPACTGRRPTLVARVGEDKKGRPKVDVYCHRGCEKDDILEALGLGWPDLYEEGVIAGRRAGRQRGGRWDEIEEEYDYVDLSGDLVFQVCRLETPPGEPKDFGQRCPKGNGGWSYKVNDLEPVLYNWPAVVRAIQNKELVLLCEGEKDANRAMEELAEFGIVSTTGPGGAEKWRPSLTPALRGARVLLIPDNDPKGRAHVEKVGRELLPVAKTLQLLELPGVPEEGGDLSDWFDAGGTAEEFRELAERAPMFADTVEAGTDTTSQLDSPYIGAEVMKLVSRPPLVARRMRDVPDPGPRRDVIETLIPELEPTTIHGYGGTTKSYIGIDLLMSVAAGLPDWHGHQIYGQKNSLMIDLELNEAEQKRRALKVAAGRGLSQIPYELHHLPARGRTPFEVFTYAYKYCEDNEIELVLLDSVGLAMVGDPGKNSDVIVFHQQCLDLFIANRVTTILIDHQANQQPGEDYQTKKAYGGSYKHNLVRSRLQVQLKEPGKDFRGVILRQHKNNLGPEADPIKLLIEFKESAVTMTRQELEHGELVTESTLTTKNRLIMALSEGPAWPADLAEELGVTAQTVSGTSKALRDEGLVQRTGNNEGNSHELELTEAGEKHYKMFLEQLHNFDPPIREDEVVKSEEEDEDDDPDPDPPSGPSGPEGGPEGGGSGDAGDGPGEPGPSDAVALDHLVDDDAGLEDLLGEIASVEDVAIDLETMPPEGWVREVAAGYRTWRRGLKQKPKPERQRKKWIELKEKVYKRYATNPESAEVRIVSIATRGGAPAAVDARAVDITPLLVELKSKTVLVHHASFDLAVLRERYGYVHEGRVLDTSLLHSMYHYAEGGKRTDIRDGKARVPDPLKTNVTVNGKIVKMASLVYVVHKYLPDVKLDKEQQLSDWSSPELTGEQVSYALKDAEVLIPLADVLVEKLEDIGMGAIVDVESRALPAKVWMERNGLPLDVARAREMGERYAREAEGALEEMAELLPSTVDTMDGKVPWSWTNPNHIRATLEVLDVNLATLPKTGKSKEPSTARDALLNIKKPTAAVQWVAAYLKWKDLVKRSHDFIEKYVELARADGTVAGGYENISTGRYNCTKPNLQQVPKRGTLQTLEGMRIRDIFRAREGEMFVVADFEQVELLLAATIAERESKIPSKMLEVFRSGGPEWDIHRATAAAVLSKAVEDVSKDERSLAKAINFGLIYGCSPSTLLETATTTYGVAGMMLADAKRYRATFFKKYPEFRAWHKKVSTACDRGRGYATTPLGRRRKLPKWASKPERSGGVAFTAAVNHPVQGAGADAMKLTLAKIFERRETAPGAPDVKMVATVHDEVILSCPEEAAEELRGWAAEIMAEAEREAVLDPESPIAVDVTVCKSWGEG